MNIINRVLSKLNLRLSRINELPRPLGKKENEFIEKYNDFFGQVLKNKRGLKTFKDYRYEVGAHPYSRKDIQCEFVAKHLYDLQPKKVLDVGSYRDFLIGMLTHYDVTTVDVRSRKSILKNESILTCDAKVLNAPSHSFDAVICLASIYTFGLGRYGDEFDSDADVKALNEMIRVLKPGGHLIFSAAVSAAEPSILFNRTRIYGYEMIRGFCDGLYCVEEKFCGARGKEKRFLEPFELTTEHGAFDIYLGCWRKG